MDNSNKTLLTDNSNQVYWRAELEAHQIGSSLTW